MQFLNGAPLESTGRLADSAGEQAAGRRTLTRSGECCSRARLAGGARPARVQVGPLTPTRSGRAR